MADTAATQVSDEERPPQEVGGSVDDPCYCLLDGVDGDDERFQVRVKRLPLKLGRLHDTDDQHFVSLGKAKAISREHARLDFCFPGGFLESNSYGDAFSLKPDDRFQNIVPESGAFCITCLSKNKIIVDQDRIEQDSITLIESGMAIKIGPVCLYFLTPLTEEQPTPKQRWSLDVSSAVPIAAKSMMSSVKEESGAKTSTHMQLEGLSWPELTNEYGKAETERRRQIVGAAIVARGVVDAAKEMGQTDVSANEIIEWLEQSDRYGAFQLEMKERMETKSYRAGVAKALTRAGFTRNHASGRHVRWYVPESVRSELGLQAANDSNEDGEAREGRMEE